MNFTVDKDAIQIQVTNGSSAVINRTDSLLGNSSILAVSVLDKDNSTNTTDINTATEFFTYVYNGSSYVQESETSNSTNFYLNFNPGCNYAAGLQNWVMNVTSAKYYKDSDKRAPFRMSTIMASLDRPRTSPQQALQVYEAGTAVTLIGNVTDDCNSGVSGATVIFNVALLVRILTLCNSLGNATGFNYSCSFDTAGKAVGDYNVTMNVTKAYNINSTVNQSSAFHIKSTPQLKYADANPRTAGWSVVRNFTINVTDNAVDTDTVYLWEAPLGTSTWTQISTSKTCAPCTNAQLSWTKSYLCSDISTKQFKFNVTDTEGNYYETTVAGGDYVGSSQSYTIGKDSVNISYVAGNETNATLNVPTLFMLRVFDLDNNTFNLNSTAYVAFNVTKTGKGSAFSTIGTNTTNASGFVSYNFTPDQTYTVSKQDWIGYVDLGQSPSCYNFNSSTIFNVTTLTNAPQLTNANMTPQTGGWGLQRIFNVTILDTNNNATVYLWKSSATSGPWTLLSQKNYNATNVTTNLSFAVNFTGGDQGTWYYMFNASNTVGNINNTPQLSIYNFTITRDTLAFQSVGGNNSISNRTGNQLDSLSLRVFDVDNSTYVASLNVAFYVTLDKITFDSGFTNATDSSGNAYYYFNATCVPKYIVGDQTWKAVITGQSNYFDATLNSQNISVRGDIQLNMTKPDSTQNFTQEANNIFPRFTVR